MLMDEPIVYIESPNGASHRLVIESIFILCLIQKISEQYGAFWAEIRIMTNE